MKALTEHEPCSYCLYMVGPDIKLFPLVYRGQNAQETMEHFMDDLINMKNFIDAKYATIKPAIRTSEIALEFKNAKICHICKKDFKVGDIKVWDHCHITGNYWGAAHKTCNLNLRFKSGKQKPKIPVVFHNCKGYDSHIILKYFDPKKYGNVPLMCIPNNMQKYIAFGIDNLIFLDSFQFQTASLEALVENVALAGHNKFKHLNAIYRDHPHKELLFRKEVFPYDYLDNFEWFNETELPPQEEFYNTLTESNIKSNQYEYAKKIWTSFGMQTFRDYHDLYLITNVLLLADVMEIFWKMCMTNYGLEPYHYFTSPGIAGDAMYKLSNAELELITDTEQYNFVEKGMRGGISQISHHYAKVNNEKCPDYDSNQPRTEIKYYDAVNLYGYAMSQPFPTGDFKWRYYDDYHTQPSSEQTYEHRKENWKCADYWTKKTLEHADDNNVGFFLEVDIEYPDQLHDKHNDYSLCPKKITLKDTGHSQFFRQRHDMAPENSEKLVPNLNNKERYVVHYRYLKLCIQQGLRITWVYRVLGFKQSPWLKKYIEFNSKMRAATKVKFEQDFFKLMNNAAYGKTLENMRKRVSIRLVSNRDQFVKWTSKSNYTGPARRFSENLMRVEIKKAFVKLNKPMYARVAILDLSKLCIAKFHYEFIMEKYGYEKARLLFTDTDSLAYLIQTNNMVNDLIPHKSLFDNSEFPVDHELYSLDNKKVPGKMNDEFKKSALLEFVGFRAKMYSFSMINEDDVIDFKKVSKGVTKYFIKSSIHHDDYKRILFDRTQTYGAMNGIRHFNHNLYTTCTEKITLSANDNKCIVCFDRVSTLVHGHYNARGILPWPGSKELKATA